MTFFSRVWRAIRGPSSASPDAVLQARIASKETPLTVCLDCRALFAVPPCDHCHQSSSCLEVRTRADARQALQLLKLDAAVPMDRPPEIARPLKVAILRAISEAKRLRHAHVGLEHLLVGLLEDAAVQQRCGEQAEPLKARVAELVGAPGDRAPAGEPAQTPDLEAVLQAAAGEASSKGHDALECADVLRAVSLRNGPTGQVLKDAGILA